MAYKLIVTLIASHCISIIYLSSFCEFINNSKVYDFINVKIVHIA